MVAGGVEGKTRGAAAGNGGGAGRPPFSPGAAA